MRLHYALLCLMSLFASSAIAGGCVPGEVSDYSASYRSERTGYFPDSSEMEGGFTDRNGHPLQTLQAYLNGDGDYVSVAMDHTDDRFPYGTKIRIPAVEKYFDRCIEFRVVDSGGRFTGRGSEKIDICNDNNSDAEASYSNGSATIYVVNGLEAGDNGGGNSGSDNGGDEN